MHISVGLILTSCLIVKGNISVITVELQQMYLFEVPGCSRAYCSVPEVSAGGGGGAKM